MKVDIYIRDKRGKRSIRIPLLPEEFTFPSGEVTFISTDIMGRGEVSEPSGTSLGHYSWESEFPGEARKNDALIRGKWQNPKSYVSTLNEWKNSGEMLNLLITGYPVNVDVYIKEFTPKGAGAFGDIHYEIELVEARTITVVTVTPGNETKTSRISYKASQYTILRGDTLWSISEKFYGKGAKWKTIYEANKEIIESHAKKRGKKNSQNGRWIWPGTIIKIP